MTHDSEYHSNMYTLSHTDMIAVMYEKVLVSSNTDVFHYGIQVSTLAGPSHTILIFWYAPIYMSESPLGWRT